MLIVVATAAAYENAAIFIDTCPLGPSNAFGISGGAKRWRLHAVVRRRAGSVMSHIRPPLRHVPQHARCVSHIGDSQSPWL